MDKSVKLDPNGPGQRLRRRRSEAGLTQDQFAGKMGVFCTYISGVERGVRSPKLDFWARAATVLGCDVGDLNPDASPTRSTPAARPEPGSLVLIRSPVEGVWVGRSASDLAALARLGHRVGVRTSRLGRLLQAAIEVDAGLAIRPDLPPAPPVPQEDGSDGLGPDYRRHIYDWAAKVVGDRIQVAARQVFRQVVVDGHPVDDVASVLGIARRSAIVLESLARVEYHAAITSEAGLGMAARIVGELARPTGLPPSRSSAAVGKPATAKAAGPAKGPKPTR